jgi:hypothetical protein
MLDKDLAEQADQWATETCKQFLDAQNPSNPLTGEVLEVYKELEEFGWFKDFPQATHKMLAMRKYGKLKWAKDHPPKPKLSKWQVVQGKGPKK